MSRSRNTAETLKKIQRHSFGRENRAGATADFQHGRAGTNDGAVMLPNLNAQLGIDPAKDRRRYFGARDNRPFIRKNACRCLLVFVDKVIGGDVTAADVFA